MSRPLALVPALLLAAAAAAAAQSTPELSRERVGSPAGPPRQGAELERITEEVSSLMRCPVCQGLSVADSPTPLAAAMKDEVRELLAAGYSGEQVLQYFEKSYGEFIRLAPKPRGFNLTVWLAPAALLLLGLVLILRRRAAPRRPAADTADADTADADLAAYRERVRQEIGS